MNAQIFIFKHYFKCIILLTDPKCLMTSFYKLSDVNNCTHFRIRLIKTKTAIECDNHIQ